MTHLEHGWSRPRVSIIMATYNRAALISASIRSILKQAFADYELIIVDDGSTDNTASAVKTHDDPRMMYFKKSHSGLAASRNYGIRQSRGEYIAYCDDDSIYARDYLKKAVWFLDKNRSYGMVYGDFRNCMTSGDYVDVRAAFDKRRLETLNFIAAFTVLHRKQCFESTGLFDERLPAREDWDMWLRISDLYPIARLRGIAGKHLYHPDIPTMTMSKGQGAAREHVIKKRISKATRENRLSEYIKENAIGIVKNLIRYGNTAYARKSSVFFFKTTKTYQTLACLGLCDLAKGKPRGSLKLFIESIRTLPYGWQKLDSWKVENILWIKINLARAYYHLGNIYMAKKICREVLKIAPHNIEAKIEMARCCVKNGLYDKALSLTGKIKLNADAYNIRGYCYFKAGKNELALREFGNAAAIDPFITIYHHNFKKVYLARKRRSFFLPKISK